MTMLKAPIAAALLLVTLLGQACTSDNIGETNGQEGVENHPAIATLVPIARQASTSAEQPNEASTPKHAAEGTIPSTETPSARTRPTQELTIPETTVNLATPTRPAPTQMAVQMPIVRVPTTQLPSPVEPEDPGQTSFVDRLNAEDKGCLPEQVSNDDQILDLMAKMETQATRELQNCLSEEAQFELYLLTAKDRTLGRKTHLCLWAGHQPLAEQNLQDLNPRSPEYERTANVKVLAPVVLQLYCKSSDPTWLGLEIDGSNERFKPRVEAIHCMVNTKGGPRDFVEWMLEDDQAVESVTRALVTNEGCPSTD